MNHLPLRKHNIHAFEISLGQPSLCPEREGESEKGDRFACFAKRTFSQTGLCSEKDGKCPRGQKAFEKPALSLLECGFSVRSCYAYVASKTFTELTLCIDGPRAIYIILLSNCWSLHLVFTEGRAPFRVAFPALGQLDWAVYVIGVETVQNWCVSRFSGEAVIVQIKWLASFLHKPQTVCEKII